MSQIRAFTEAQEVIVLDHHLNHSKAIRKTAKHFGVSPTTIMKLLHRYGLNNNKIETCPHCKRLFQAKHWAPGRAIPIWCEECASIIEGTQS